jgi:uncharacterized DUF497 family protein
MRFAWDERKAAVNLAKHGIRFEDAITAFDDPWALRAPDAAHSTAEEKRIWLIGESDSTVVVVVFTERKPGRVTRIISARPANRGERMRYDESKRIPL